MISNIIETVANERALEKYSDKKRLLKEAVPYVGQPTQSASDPNKIFLRLNPLLSNGALLEFETEDVVFAENIETVANNDGETIQIFKVWIRVGSIGFKVEPFTV